MSRQNRAIPIIAWTVAAAFTWISATALVAVAQPPSERFGSPGFAARKGRPAKQQSEPKKGIIREGVRLELKGRFHGGGVERYVFQPHDQAESFQVLENLALERIANVVNLGTREWTVTAEVTEFRGVNYLIIKRATVTSTLGAAR